MKEFKILELNLKNFKGVKQFNLNANGGNLNIWGRNATGKTTIFDSFTWLLFGKDSMNRSNFNVKTLDEDGNVAQHGVDHEVEGVFLVDEKKLTLRRVHAEQWTKRQGSANKVFTGHKNSFYIDEEPVQKKVYTEKVNEIISEDVFKLITNPLYFNEQLSWKERRDTLINLAGNVTDEDIVKENKSLESFIEELKGRELESYQKIVREKRKKINEEVDKIPIRIDELNLTMPDVKGLRFDELEGKIIDIDESIVEYNQKINDLHSGSEINNKRKELSDLELKLSDLKNAHNKELNENIYKKQAKIQEVESNIKLMESEKENTQNNIERNKNEIERIEKEVSELRKEWAIKNKEEFQYEATESCPTCEQALPKDQVESAKEKALESFNKSKSKNLESVQVKAQELKEVIVDFEQTIEKQENKVIKIDTEMESNKDKVSRYKDDLERLKEQATDVTESDEYNKAIKEKESIQKEIERLDKSVSESVEQHRGKIAELEGRKSDVQKELNKLELARSSKERIKELEGQAKDLARQIEELDRGLYLADEYTKTKVNLLEDKINSKFKHAKFKLFEKQINDGLREVCETTYNGVPYNLDLNNGDKINVGLDIIRTLNEHYGVQAPIFIDNAESVVNIEEVDSQMISLRVADTDLTVEDNAEGVA